MVTPQRTRHRASEKNVMPSRLNGRALGHAPAEPLIQESPHRLRLVRLPLVRREALKRELATADTIEIIEHEPFAGPEANGTEVWVLSLPDTHEGHQTCRLARRRAPHAVILVLAMPGQKNGPERWRGNGADEVLDATLADDTLGQWIHSAFRRAGERHAHRTRVHDLEEETRQHKALGARLKQLATRDALTGLYNRRQLEQALAEATAAARRNGRRYALSYLDLDQFHFIKAADGPAAADAALRQVAHRLRRHLGAHPLIARPGGDEFAVLWTDLDREAAFRKTEELRKLIASAPVRAGDRCHDLTASAGVVCFDAAGTLGADELLARADQACFVAKRRGRNQTHVYTRAEPELKELNDDLRWMPRLREALENDGFALAYQPVRDLASGRVDRYEVLLRLKGGDELAIEPSLIPVAERTGLVRAIDGWVLRRTLEVMKTLPAGPQALSFNVNLSGHTVQNTACAREIYDLVQMSGLDGRRITFEITETAAIGCFERTRELIAALRSLGCRFALDDFGSGFNSYNYLKQLSVDDLKIDGAFIRNLANDGMDRALVRSMVEIAHTLKLRTVAEFVEDAETLAALGPLGVDAAQGFHVGTPCLGPPG